MESFWYRDAVIYEIDPALFRDGDGDGYGDLRGITERLPYLRGLGVTCLWLLPVYLSPFRDGGYDVVDHLGVAPRFGSLADMAGLLEKAQELGIRVVIDLVVQHTSRDHPWFEAARRDRNSPYRDYYIWSDKPEPHHKPLFPTVEDSVWTWDEAAGQYYRHLFYSHEPDLNMGSEKVRSEIKRILSFWLKLGVSGFRVDAATHMVGCARMADPSKDGFWILEEMREHVVRLRPDAILLGEVNVPPQQYVEYFGKGDRLTIVTNFWLNAYLYLALARQLSEPLVRALHHQAQPPDACQYAVWARNHDELDLQRLDENERKEVMRRFAPDEKAHIYNRGIRRRLPPMLNGDRRHVALVHAIVMSLPGTPILRYGEEIGMGDDLSLQGRRAVRTAMQWSEEPHAGFSSEMSKEPAVPVIGEGRYRYQALNVREQSVRGDSLLVKTSTLLRTRLETPEIGRGRCSPVDAGCPSVLALRHELVDETVLTLANLSAQEVTCEVPDLSLDGMNGVLADGSYEDRDANMGKIVVRGYGYRWFRVKRGRPSGLPPMP